MLYILQNESGKILAKADWPAPDFVKTDRNVVYGYDGNLYFEGEEPKTSLKEQVETAYTALDSNVEARLDAFAATRRYSSINSACSYSISTDPVFRAEGEYCVQARDATYRKCYDLLAEYMPDVLAGKRPIPSWEEIEAQLPPLVWPDEQVEEVPATESAE